MPLYEYQCTKCDNRFERIQKFSDPLVTECPLCAGRVERTISVPAVHFKGSGWYVTDYANKNSAGKSTGKSDDKPASGDGKSDKSESKSETKTESKTESKSTNSSESKASEKK